MLSPLPVPDMLISMVLQDISELLEAEAPHQAEPIEVGPCIDISASMFLYIL
jgi:hypothetical protein